MEFHHQQLKNPSSDHPPDVTSAHTVVPMAASRRTTSTTRSQNNNETLDNQSPRTKENPVQPQRSQPLLDWKANEYVSNPFFLSLGDHPGLGYHLVTSYFTKLKSLSDELKEFPPNTTCTCGAIKHFLEYYNQNLVLQFLTGLNESYASVRAQILLNEPIPNLSRVFPMIVQEKRQQTLGSSDNPPLASSIRLLSTNLPRNKKPKPSCSHCGKPSHLVDKCFFIHDFPLGYGDKKKNEKSKAQANQASTSNPLDHATGHSITSDLSSQYQQLISLLSQQLNQAAPRIEPAMNTAASNLDGNAFSHPSFQ
uniref:Uncharacterized protein n=1 Tax=Cannabis sativa TaxID=3483 RepID=A0A803PBM6_CANSA